MAPRPPAFRRDGPDMAPTETAGVLSDVRFKKYGSGYTTGLGVRRFVLIAVSQRIRLVEARAKVRVEENVSQDAVVGTVEASPAVRRARLAYGHGKSGKRESLPELLVRGRRPARLLSHFAVSNQLTLQRTDAPGNSAYGAESEHVLGAIQETKHVKEYGERTGVDANGGFLRRFKLTTPEAGVSDKRLTRVAARHDGFDGLRRKGHTSSSDRIRTSRARHFPLRVSSAGSALSQEVSVAPTLVHAERPLRQSA